MPTTFHRMMSSPSPAKGKVVVGKSSKEEADETKTGITITAAIFFDGTLNNRTNSTERILKSPVAKTMDDGQTSYDNYYSNVAILEYMNAKKTPENNQVSVYIEGEGTDDRQEDDTNGFAFGDGPTGIPGKVTKGIDNLVIGITDKRVYEPKKERIDKLKISVFGFSRGAAAARHFISRKAELCARLRIPPAAVEYTFVGIFDTVSSYEHGASFATNVATVVDFDNDVQELGLRLSDPAIKKVVHLVAGDEYRQNFALTSIASAIAAGTGYEVELPGVHSDIGGGYGEVEDEDRLGTYEELLDLVKQGWYRKEQVNLLMGRASRRLTYHYQLLPLAVMAKLATKYGLQFTARPPREVVLTVPADLLPARTELLAQILHNDGAHHKRATLSPSVLGRVRNAYLHRSVSDGIGMEGNLDGGRPARRTLPG